MTWADDPNPAALIGREVPRIPGDQRRCASGDGHPDKQ